MGQRGRLGAWLVRVSEYAHVVEFHLSHKAIEVFELCLCLAWKANDQRRPHHQVGESRPRVIDEPPRHVQVTGTVHRAQDVPVGMLEWHVEVREQRLVLGHHVDDLEREHGRVDVQHPHPRQVRDLLDDHLE